MAVYPFPSSNLSLAQVLRNYNIQSGSSFTSMNQLRGQFYWYPNGTRIEIPTNGNFLLSSLSGNYSLDPNSQPFEFTAGTSSINPPTNSPPPVAFRLELIGGGGGGGGAGGGYNDGITVRSGGAGGGGGGGGKLIFYRIPYVGGPITLVSFPSVGTNQGEASVGGAGGFGGLMTSDGNPGGSGALASVTYNGMTFSALGGGGGGNGFRALITVNGNPGSAGTGGGFSYSTAAEPLQKEGTTGGSGNGSVSGFPNGGSGGNGGGGGNGFVGVIEGIWFFTP
jgi:hypothetical protein